MVSDIDEVQSFFFQPDEPDSYLLHTMKQLDHMLAANSADGAFYLAKFLCDIFTELIYISSAKNASFSALPAHVYQMKVLFDEEYDKNHNLNDLEESLNISKYRLCRDFSKYIGVSPLQYLNAVRIRQAKDLQTNSPYTVHKIGSMVGIPNTTHFINLFKEDTGVTPLQYRQTKNRFPF